MPNKKTVGWGEERTPTNVWADADGGIPASLQPTSAIPDSWISVALGEAIDYGKTIKAEPSEINDDTWVLELEDIEKDSSKVLQRLTFADRKPKSTKNRFQTGDVLYGKLRPYLNKVVIADDDGVCSTEIIPLASSEHLDNRYLFYWLKHPEFLTYVTKVGYGVNMPRLGTKDGNAAPFVLAPLAEQKQIAAKLDELLAQVDTLKTRLDAIPAILKRFRQSVLAAAVSGRLTEEWREANTFQTQASITDITATWASIYDKKGRRYKAPVFGPLDDSLPPLPAKW
ncbi:MAG: restriction endonuclease subunit S [Gammaproteobacteria bacterium]|nr:restriction endonuclease subunit S [Gammaproteobacteria bacterium]MCF6362624.1 restriction endonuclease subunit S [Gammaproteobacteria bacterium]